MGCLVSCGVRQMGTIIVSKYMVWYRKERERETEWFMCCGERYNRRDESSEQRAEMGGLIVTQGCGEVWCWSVAGAHVWVYGPDKAVVCFAVFAPDTT